MRYNLDSMIKPPSSLEHTLAFDDAFVRMEYGREHLFVTGRAGTGKSTLLKYFREHTSKKIVVAAPTGVAAVAIGGQTIHSLFGFKPHVTVASIRRLNPSWERAQLFKHIDALVIDEISMVRADLVDCIDAFLRLNGPSSERPFGGIQIIGFGDLYQLPPVVTDVERETFFSRYKTPYFFSADACRMDRGFVLQGIELNKMYRQSDEDFRSILNAIRVNAAEPHHWSKLNSRYEPYHATPRTQHYVHLTTTNARAQMINEQHLAALEGKTYAVYGFREGSFDEHALPADETLLCKVGSQVMMVNNDPEKRWMNGTIGTISEIAPGETPDRPRIMVTLESGELVDVRPYRWEMYEHEYDPHLRSVVAEVVGTYTQYPFKLAWAITIHKSQGKTFERMILDIGRGTFAHGQLYVALSRCRTLEGLVLRQKLLPEHVIVEPVVQDFLATLHLS